MKSMKGIPLVNGRSMPALGIGTWELKGSSCFSAVKEALVLGYRHIDTAEMYGNEAEIGLALAQSGIPRDELFLTTKVWTDHFHAEDFKKAAENSLRRLKLDHLDLLLIHWPNPAVPLGETLGALCGLAKEGKTLAIGVSNFSAGQLREAVSLVSAPIACDQVRFNLEEERSDLLAYAGAQKINVTAYSPLGRGKFLENPKLLAAAQKYRKTPAQVALRWLVQQPGVSAIPKASGKIHLKENLEIFDFELEESESRLLAGLKD
jgi:diketogulonate reductase-like aldo/keto reductase